LSPGPLSSEEEKRIAANPVEQKEPRVLVIT